MDTDNDTVFLVNGYYDYQKALEDEGFDATLSDIQYHTMGEFISFRKGTENYIVTENPDFYADYVKATEGAKALNLLNKEDRIKLFQAIMAGYEKMVPAQIDFNFDVARVRGEPIAQAANVDGGGIRIVNNANIFERWMNQRREVELIAAADRANRA
jgi:hypothetical protein